MRQMGIALIEGCLARRLQMKLFKHLLPTALAVSFAVAGVAPLSAAPTFVPKSVEVTSDVQQVQSRKWRRANRIDRRIDRMQRRADRRDFYRNGDGYYFNGHRGYRYRRDGYNEYNGWWFPAAAFVAGALITGAVNSPRAVQGGSHEEWCYDRYRSYRAYDNTYQPYNGARRQCYSPYD
jgi:Ni/Co efflux regulator RcnB